MELNKHFKQTYSYESFIEYGYNMRCAKFQWILDSQTMHINKNMHIYGANYSAD